MRRSAFALALAMAITLLPACGGQSDASSSNPAASSGISSSVSSSTEVESSASSSADESAPAESTPSESAPDANNPGGFMEVADLSLNKTDFSLFKAGETYKLEVISTNLDLEAGELVWTTNNETVATVAEDGTVAAVAPGNAVITVAFGDLTASCTVRCSFEAEVVEPELNTPAASGAVNLADFYAEVYTNLYPADENGDPTGPFTEDFAAAPDMLEGFYPGLTAIETKQLHLFKPMMTGVPFELLLVEVANTADVETVKTMLNTRIETEKDNTFNYPMIIENWELNSKIAVNGNYIMLAVCEQSADFVSAFNAKF